MAEISSRKISSPEILMEIDTSYHGVVYSLHIFEMLCIATQSRYTFHTILSSGVSAHFIAFKKRVFTSNAQITKHIAPFFDG